MTTEKTSWLLRIHPPRLFFLLFAVGFIGGYFFHSEPLPHAGICKLVGTLFGIAGLCIILWAWRLFKQAQNEIHPTSETNTALIISGPYRYTRHPMYVGLVLMLLGAAVFLNTLPMFISTVALFFILDKIFIPFEEAKMERIFGESYRNYKSQVRRWT
jgi:protein-S-isoprenylcysteine O-methyltransferase Ste14